MPQRPKCCALPAGASVRRCDQARPAACVLLAPAEFPRETASRNRDFAGMCQREMKRALVSPQHSAPPDCLTVEEAAAVLRISRTTAYAQVNEYLDSGGASGVPAIRVARQIRVPRAALEDQLRAPITWPIPKSVAGQRGAGPTTLVHPSPRDSQISRVPRESTQLALSIDG